MNELPPSDRPRVSVLMTTYNGARLIGRSIDSLLRQTFDDFELIVVDDCSTDDTRAVLHAIRDPRLRVIGAPRNLGVVGTRNLGFQAARGVYVASLDHDDLSRPTRLHRQVEYLDANPGVVLVGTAAHSFDGSTIAKLPPLGATTPARLRWLLHLGNPLVYSSIMFRAAAVRALGILMREDFVYADDFDLYQRLGTQGAIARVDEPLTIYRLHAENTFRKRRTQMADNAADVLRAQYAALFGADDPLPARLARFVTDQDEITDAARMDQFGADLKRLVDAFLARHAPAPQDAAWVRADAGRLWRRIITRHLRAGRLGAMRQLWSHPGLSRPADALTPRIAVFLAMGAMPFKPALRTLRQGLEQRRAAPAPLPPPARLFGQTCRPLPRDPASPPTLHVVVDTEAEFDWTRPFAHDLNKVASIRDQARAQVLFDRYGVRPVYVVDYAVASQPEAYLPLRAIHARGGCVIGAHLHPWITPPLEEEPSVFNSFPGNLEPELQAQKLDSLMATIRANFGVAPLFYKAGRYGLGKGTIGLIEARGVLVDFSILPGVDLRPKGGPDYRNFAALPYAVDGSPVLCMPATRAYVGALAGLGQRLNAALCGPAMQAVRLPGVLARLGLLEGITLTPEGVTAAEQIRLIRALLRRGQVNFVLHYHSPSLTPGNTPYVRSEADLAEFLSRLAAVLEFFFETLGGVAGQPEDLIRLAPSRAVAA